MIVITGAAGFIASALAGRLNKLGYKDLILIDKWNNKAKRANYADKQYQLLIDRDIALTWMRLNSDCIDFVIHLGARTDTTETDEQIFDRLNINYTKDIWQFCTNNCIPLIYASSAATYGLGELGYSDSHDVVDSLQPLNAYGRSKNDIDKWILRQEKTPPFWAGLKFFNVYGPNEYHKGRMASVVMHSFNHIKETGFMNLFRSHRPDFADGQQSRDFVYVKDVVNVIVWLMQNKPESGLYNVGTGKARPFFDLATAVFNAMNLQPDIRFVDTPMDIRDKYQYFTEADITKLRKAGYDKPFTTLEDGVSDYVVNYLSKGEYI